MTRSDLIAVLAAAACLLPSTALAQGKSVDVDEAAARVLFAEGRKLAADGAYPAACPKFEESFRLDPGIGTNFNLADCWEHIGRTASAWARFLAVAASARAAGQAERAEVARARAAALEPALARLVVEVAAPADDLTVERDGSPVGRASWGVPVPVDPGAHVVRASARGKKPFEATVTAASNGEAVTVVIAALEDEPAPPAAAPPPPALPPAPAQAAPPVLVHSPPRPRSRVPAVAAGAVGLAAFAASAIFGLEFLADNGDAKMLCPGNVCTQMEKDRHEQLTSQATRDANRAYVAAAVGAVAVIATAVLWWRW